MERFAVPIVRFATHFKCVAKREIDVCGETEIRMSPIEMTMTADDVRDLGLRSVPLDVPAPDVPITGMNGALKRLPKGDATGVEVLARPGVDRKSVV